MVNIGIIGYGYWGPNLVRNFSALSNCRLRAVADSRKERIDILNRNYPTIRSAFSADEIIFDKEIDAVVIATPVFTHYDLAKRALEEGKHVMLEKPMTSSSKEAIELINIAEKKNLVLMVDHTFLYTGAVQKMKVLIDNNTIGKPIYFDSSRINLGLFQPDINVLWDLAPHDISILTHLIKETPHSINATGISHTNNEIENVAFMTVNYQSNFIAHFNCSWTSPVKIRQTLIGGDQKMIVYNDLDPYEKIRIYDTGYKHQTDEDKTRIMVDYRTGDIFIPKIADQEALHGVAKDFISCIISGSVPLADSNLGLNVVKILEASQKSIKNKGKEIIIN